MVDFILERGNYWAIMGLMMIGLYIAFSATNLMKRLIGLSTFQTSVILFYVTLGRISGGTAPIYYGADYPGHGKDHGEAKGHGTDAGHGSLEVASGPDIMGALDAGSDPASVAQAGLENVYSNPLPHVLMLTAIVVGVATLAVGLALVVRIREAYGTIETDEIREMDLEVAIAEHTDDEPEAKPA